jgi:hypothetical protein
VRPFHVSAWIEDFPGSKPTVKQKLAAVRMLYDFLVVLQITPTWRATGITIYLENDGRLEHAQQMAGHESPRTTRLYDRTKDEITLSEVERIRL